MSTDNAQHDREPMETVFLERPRCSVCECYDLETIRSYDQGDGSIMQRKRCKDCGYKFKVVWE